MVNVAKKRLSKQKLAYIQRRLIELFATPKKKGDIAHIIDELLTDAEKIMLAKRLVVILMLDQGQSHYAIRKALDASSESVARWEEALHNNQLKTVLKNFKNKGTQGADILKTIESILLVGDILPPYVGKRRLQNAKALK